MKKLSIELFVTNGLELITGLDLIGDVDLKFSGLKLVAGKGTKTPTVPTPEKGKFIRAKLASLFDDTIIVDNPNADILLSAPEGILFIGQSDRVMQLLHYMETGKAGKVAESIDATSYLRGFWSTNDIGLLTKVINFLNDGPEKLDDGEKPAKKPAKKSSKPKKPADKPEDKPAEEPEKPAEEPAREIPEEPEKPAEAEEAPAEKPAEGDKPVESECPCGSLSLEQLFLMTAPPRTDDEGDAAEAADVDAVEETAEETCRRLCAEEDIAYDI